MDFIAHALNSEQLAAHERAAAADRRQYWACLWRRHGVTAWFVAMVVAWGGAFWLPYHGYATYRGGEASMLMAFVGVGCLLGAVVTAQMADRATDRYEGVDDAHDQ